MAKKKSAKLSATEQVPSPAIDEAVSGVDDRKPLSKTAAAKRWIAEHPEAESYAEIIAGVKSEYGFDLKNADIANAKAFLKKSGKIRAVRKVETGKRRSVAVRTRTPSKSATSGRTAISTEVSMDIVSATLNLVEAVGLDQARTILTGLGK